MSLYRIDELFKYEKGSLQSTKCTPGQYNFITASSEWKTHSSFTHDCEALVFAAAASGSLGRTHYVKGKFIASDLCFILTPKDSINFPLDLKFYHIIFNLLRDDIVRNTKAGTSKEAIGLSKFGKYELPYFGIDHQEIVKAQFGNVTEIKDLLTEEQNHQAIILTQLRQAFLREAMQGKLVPQEPNDEPASELLKKIKASRHSGLDPESKTSSKKLKELPPINLEEVPYEIPSTWVWCRLGEIIKFSNNLNIESNLKPDTIINYVDIDSIDNRNFRIREIKQKSVAQLSSRARRVLRKNYILYSLVRPYLNNIAVIEDDKENFIGSTGFAVFNGIIVENNFIKFLLLSDYIRKVFLELLSGFNSPSITHEQFTQTIIPLPPLAEQQRIVSKLNQLMQFCDQLEENINTTKKETNLLLQTVLREALEPKGC